MYHGIGVLDIVLPIRISGFEVSNRVPHNHPLLVELFKTILQAFNSSLMGQFQARAFAISQWEYNHIHRAPQDQQMNALFGSARVLQRASSAWFSMFGLRISRSPDNFNQVAVLAMPCQVLVSNHRPHDVLDHLSSGTVLADSYKLMS